MHKERIIYVNVNWIHMDASEESSVLGNSCTVMNVRLLYVYGIFTAAP
jgi:hypothetical protein